jgi:hypothetical protein
MKKRKKNELSVRKTVHKTIHFVFFGKIISLVSEVHNCIQMYRKSLSYLDNRPSGEARQNENQKKITSFYVNPSLQSTRKIFICLTFGFLISLRAIGACRKCGLYWYHKSWLEKTGFIIRLFNGTTRLKIGPTKFLSLEKN